MASNHAEMADLSLYILSGLEKNDLSFKADWPTAFVIPETQALSQTKSAAGCNKNIGPYNADP